MKVKIRQDCYVEGDLTRVISEQNGHHPNIVVEMSVTEIADVTVILSTLDLSSLVRFARGSKVKEIREAVRPV